MFIKRFFEWILVKERLDSHEYEPPRIREGELWWCAAGENVGVEISGKGRSFSRPVIIFKVLGRHAFFGVPVSTVRKSGKWYVSFEHAGLYENALISQARMFSYKRLLGRMGELDERDFRKVKEAFYSLFR